MTTTEQNTTRRSHLRTAVAEAETAGALAELLLAERDRLRESNERQPLGTRACRTLTEAVDAVVQRLFQLSLPEDAAQRDAARPLIAVVATGGYGRRELCPFSDVDVTFIVGEDEDPGLDATVRRMFLLLMETFTQRAGLKVGYGYRTPADVAQLDHQTQTALLDMRVVAGSHAMADRFQSEIFRHVWPAAFIRQKVKERRLLWEKHGATLYRIEPEVREGPGGLRDLHLAEWVSALSFPSTRGDVWRQLQRLGIVSRRDEHDVSDARDFLLTVRSWMHWHTGRPADLLVRERQELLAEALGLEDDDQASRVERFMERYYAHAESVNRITSFVIERCLAERLSLTDELACAGSELLPAYPWLQVRSPRFLVELGQHYQEHGLVPGHDLRRMVAQHLDSVPELSVDIEAAENFLGLLRAPAPSPPLDGPNQWAPPLASPGVWATLKLLADMGILQRLLPEVGVAYPRVPFDQVHRHTIGYHSLEGVRALERLRSADDERLQEFRRAWSEVTAPELIFLATLLHDVGKVFCTSGHAETGARIAREICSRLRLDEAAAAKVETLVRHHLLMSETAQLRDLTQEKTVFDFIQVIDSPDLLNMLLLLTYADMEATGVLSPVKIRFLEELYFRAEPLLAEGAPDPSDEVARARRFRTRLSRRLSSANLTPDQIREHTEEMPVAYLLNTRPEQIAVHIRMMEALQQDGPVVEFDNELGSEMTALHVCTLERPEPGLLSLLAGVLYAHEVGVHAAQVFTRTGDPAIALDTLWVDFHGRTIPPLKRMELEQDLIAALRTGDLEPIFARYRKQPPPPIPPIRIRVDNAAAERDSVVEIQAEDQPALLYRIARSMAALGWNIHSARISTRGDIARDAFYVVGADGEKLVEREADLVESFLEEFSR